jgi:antirestriction protein ArdC
MSRSIGRARIARASLYQEITDKIIAELEAGRVPWVQPWGTAAAKASLTIPTNYDFIQVPRPDAYFEPINWHRTALHELGHWTGAAQRLDRDLSGSFGSKKYAQEELVAEITSAFVCASLGIVPTVRHADYIGSWLEVLREDDRAIVRAASAASKAADYLLAFCRESNECVEGVESSNHLLVSDRQETCA